MGMMISSRKELTYDRQSVIRHRPSNIGRRAGYFAKPNTFWPLGKHSAKSGPGRELRPAGDWSIFRPLYGFLGPSLPENMDLSPFVARKGQSAVNGCAAFMRSADTHGTQTR